MNRHFATVISLCVLVLAMGCLQADANMRVFSNGSGFGEVRLDLSGLDSGNPDSNALYSKDAVCETLLRDSADTNGFTLDSVGFSFFDGAACEGTADFRARLFKDNIDFVRDGIVTIENSGLAKRYVFSLKLPNGDSSSTPGPVKSDLLSRSNIRLSLEIEMPGKIKSSNVGSISADQRKVSIDVVEEFAKVHSGISIVSEEWNWEPAIAVAILLVLVMASVFFLRQKKRKPTSK